MIALLLKIEATSWGKHLDAVNRVPNYTVKNSIILFFTTLYFLMLNKNWVKIVAVVPSRDVYAAEALG